MDSHRRNLPTQAPGDAPTSNLRSIVRRVIFESTPGAPRVFDVVLIAAIIASVLAVLLDSVPEIHARWGELLNWVEWGFTIAFTLEYAVRLWCVGRPLLYARSFYGVIDLLGVLPTWLSLLFAGTQYMLVIRILRVLRVFRVLRMVHWVTEATYLTDALLASRRKIGVFLFAVMTLVVVFGAALYVIEGPEKPFDSIPIAIYWAIVTLTTVGYGDIAPGTPLGRMLAACIMVMGYGIIAVPTGIVTVELNEAMRRQRANAKVCPDCSAEGHFIEATYCWRCGHTLEKGAKPVA
jgi:voltage-gated potassium channel